MPISREQYSRKQTMDLKRAIQAALADFIAGIECRLDGQDPARFTQVFDEWASWEDAYESPAACVETEGDLQYGDALMTPHLLEDTWEVQGEPGWGIYQLGEVELSLSITIRAGSKEERGLMVAGVEQAFVEPGVLMNHQRGRRNGRLIAMPGYYGLDARYSLVSQRVLDNPEDAARNRWEAVFIVRAEAQHVKVDRVAPWSIRIIPTIT